MINKVKRGKQPMPVKIGGINDRSTRLNNDIESDRYLQVNCCGIFEKTAESSTTVRPYGRKDYQLIIIANGGTVFKNEGEEITLSNGEMLLIPPHVRNEYRYSDPIDAMWIHFSGTAVADILDSYGILPFTKYTVSNTAHFFSYAEKIIKEFQLQKTGFMNNCNAYLLNILTLAKRRIEGQKKEDSASLLSSLTLTLEDMQTDFSSQKYIPDYAKACNLSVSRFAHLFTEAFGISPYRYLLNVRISQAKYLLTQTNLSVTEIAKSVGYEDPFYFSRIFKKTLGVSPKVYRTKSEKH